ncbi:ABC transporter permease [Herbaspirillum lusitanum]|uniref:ABC transporter permease n=1 Tax=Herbaspirillum lusitanum TaxID=213312 RepID=A0ABW9A727_9BURK
MTYLKNLFSFSSRGLGVVGINADAGLADNPAGVDERLSGAGLWQQAWHRLLGDRVGVISLAIVAAYLLLLALSGSGLVAGDWDDEVAVAYAPPSFLTQPAADAVAAKAGNPVQYGDASPALPGDNPRDPLRNILRELRAEHGKPASGTILSDADYYGVVDPLRQELAEIRKGMAQQAGAVAGARHEQLLFGADKWGHDIIKKTIKGAQTSIVVGLVAALLAVALGTLFGAVSGYFGGWVDDLFNWFYNVFTAIPYLLLVLAVAAVLQQKGTGAIVLILGLTGWTGTYRLMRAEYIKHKSREYVMAAQAIGASHASRLFTHIFPNVSHVVLVQLSILVVGFIKSEVVLSFLGFGVPVGSVSWGSMLNEAQNELILGKWWQMVAASVAMAVLVTAFSLLTDALRDALDPKLK